VERPRETGSFAASTPVAAPAETPRDSDLFVSLDRLKTHDEDYVLLIAKHPAAKSHLASPLKGTPEFEAVVDWVLGNGYGIEDVKTAWVYLNGIVGGIKPLEWFEETVRADHLNADPQSLFERSLQQRRKTLRMVMRLTEDEDDLLDSLWSIAPNPPRKIGPATEYMPHIPLVDGEPILRDEDWMSLERRQIVQAYQGPRRSTRALGSENRGPMAGQVSQRIPPELEKNLP
jgi:hypothetical protein